MTAIFTRLTRNAMLTMLLCLPTPALAQENDIPAEFPDVYECRLPDFQEVEDFYAVNPVLRSYYYAFIQRGMHSHPSHTMHDEGLSKPEEFLFMGRFRLFVEDFFEDNEELMRSVHQMSEDIVEPPEKLKLIAFRHKIKEIEKFSNRLSGKLDMLLPTEMEFSRNKKQWYRYYVNFSRKHEISILTRILMVKIHKLQLDLCNFFFPNKFTIDVEKLDTQQSPKHQLDEIEIIAKVLAARFPKRGLPRGFLQ
jgi:hypothetical protein